MQIINTLQVLGQSSLHPAISPSERNYYPQLMYGACRSILAVESG